ncbi:MAG: NAD-glutamate dehydrogenase [Alphaproteobacteria bacterium]|nr:NAD-glutamate dehydrogenase [Alphaproteobacteria bacterium]
MTAALEADPQGFSQFAKHFFAGAAPEDLTVFSKDIQSGIARLFWQAAEARKPGEMFVRVFTPAASVDGFAAPVTLLATINDDKPFLVDSILSELGERGLKVKAVFHPIFKVKRDANGVFRGFVFDGSEAASESMICVAVSRLGTAERMRAVEGGVTQVLRDVRVAVGDWKATLTRLDESIAELWQNPPKIPKDELDESLAFLQWLKQNHFTFLGTRDYAFDPKGDGQLTPLHETGLGLLRDPERRVIRRGQDRATMTPEVRAFMMQPSPLIVTKSLEKSPVHRRVQEDYIGVKRFDKAGNLVGERRFIGLFTSTAYHDSPREIPFLRRKVANVMAQSGFAKGSHNAKALAVVLENLPRDELFQVSEADLLKMGPALAYLGDRPDTNVFIRFDTFERFASVHVYFPADKFRGGLMRALGGILTDALGGQVTSAYPHTEEGQMARIHFMIVFPDRRPASYDHDALKARLTQAVRLWSDDFADALTQSMAPEHADAIFAQYAGAFSEAYREAFGPAEAILDIAKIEEVAAAGAGALALRSSGGKDPSDGVIHFKIYHAGAVIELSDLLPVLEDFGLRVIEEVNYPVKRAGVPVTIHDLRLKGQLTPEREASMRLFEDAFLTVWNGGAESDRFNRLILFADLPWRDVAMLRSVAKYLRQATFGASQALMEEALARNPRIAGALVRLFKARFDLATANRAQLEAKINGEIDEALAKVPSLDDDRIVRRFRNVIQSMLRTNFFQKGKPSIAFKIDSSKIEDLPLPRPMFEIFVYSPEVEGVHLRFGKVARGGLRWSDRREDFRTEVLGLVKAQQVKNAVIVPVGSKGGFYPKKLPPPSNREAWMAGGIAAYKTFIASLLDMTDNIAPDGKIVPPADVVRHDPDDPYLVVAADKGTATFSDIANGISKDYGFWLGDAFASGGSAGYDHKKMGITAKGAWETVKRHFREIGTDIQTTPFTVVGVGDMSGDVFGNGMLLSKATKLVAAFDHRDIFLDPSPDPAVSFAERQRIFNLPRSSWADYDQAKISKGGGVYSRSMKKIPLSPEVKALTGLTADSAEPAELMKALLKAPADLLWFGGIGTYVKSSAQSHADVGDKANDALRVDGKDIRAKVVGEGANLGMTQAGRIEYAHAGGRLNTDAIDNSAGVDTSDHEVNLKILLNGSIGAGELKAADRDPLLVRMTDEVGHLVLADNYNQSLALSVAQLGGAWESDAYGRFMRALEREGRLNRSVEGLPSNDNLRERANRNEGLTRPELAVLLAYAKLQLFDELNSSALPDDPFYAGTLKAYFPSEAAKYAKGMGLHRLKREIVATVLTNEMINRGGPVFMHRLKEASAAEAPALARAYTIASQAFGTDKLVARINALDNKIAAEVQLKMHARLAMQLLRQTLWFFRHVPATTPIADAIAPYAQGIDKLRGTFSTLVSDAEGKAISDSIAELRAAGVPDDLADDIGALSAIGATPDITRLSTETKKPLDMVAGAYFAAARTIGVDRLRLAAERMNLPEHWDRLAVRRLIDDLFVHQRELAARALSNGTTGDNRKAGNAAVDTWAQGHREQVDRVGTLIGDLERSGTFTVARLTLAASQIRDLLA